MDLDQDIFYPGVRRWLRNASLAFLLLALLAFGVGRATAQTTTQFPTNPWVGFAPARIQCGELVGANFNTTTDQAIVISYPSSIFVIDQIDVSGPSTSFTTAQGGFYTGASKSGVTIVASSQGYTALTTNTANATGNEFSPTISTAGNTTNFNINTVYFSLTTAQGAAATANIRIYCRPHYN